MNNPNSHSTLDDWVEWLLHLHSQEIDLGLSRIQIVAESMQLLRPAPLIITVAGTNGKGSSVAMLTAMFDAAGYHVGTYTSPHIVSFCERIQINQRMVSEQIIVNAFTEIEASREHTKLTYFEFSTLAALKIFNDAQLDVVILEVGLGGRLDAVNVVDADATLITAIDIDHIDWLGDDRNIIATEKAGVMREHQLSVCSDPNVPDTLIDYANNLSVQLSIMNRDYAYELQKNAWQLLDLKNKSHRATYSLPALQGDFQVQNAAGVVQLMHKINSTNEFAVSVSEDAINQGLQKVSHPGRLQSKQVAQQQWLIDVAHNPQSAKVLAEYLAQRFNENSPSDKKTDSHAAVFSALNDKDMLPMVKAIKPYVSSWYIADLKIPRASSVKELTDVLVAADIPKEVIYPQLSVAEAVNKVMSSTEKNILVWGSFFTVSQVLQNLPE